jgi:ABC-type glycerol-3-phosphate transport system substrate-binding protein
LSRNESGELMGLPFAADTPVLVYNTNTYATAPLDWTKVTTGTFIFPGAETSALTVLDEYLALGGPLTDGSGKVALRADILAKALAFFRAAGSDGLLPMSTLAYADSAATWQAFRDGHATLAVTSARYYLAEWDRAPLAAGTLIPAPGGNPLALVQGWSWAIVSTMPERQQDAADLLAWLTAPPQLSAWTQAAGMLPTRASILSGWPASPRAAFADTVLSQAQLRPPDKILSVVGPPLRQAVADVLYGRATPQSAAAAVVDVVNEP